MPGRGRLHLKNAGRLFLGLWLFNVCALRAADYPVWNAVDLTAALGRAQAGDRVLVHKGPYAGNWTVPAGVSLLGEPEFIPGAQQRVALNAARVDTILRVATRAGAPATQVRGFFLFGAQRSALVVFGDGPAYVCNNQFDNNTAQNGGAIYSTASGALYIQTNYISANTAVANGGGVYLAGAANVYLRKNEFKGNHAGLDGGGLSAGGNLKIFSENDRFEENGSDRDGGAAAIVSNLRESTFHDAELWRNHAQRDGGGLVVDRASLLINSGDSEGSSARRNGGFVAARTASLILLSHDCLSATAVERGGGVYSDASILLAQDNRVENGGAKYGAGMFIQNGVASFPQVLRNTFLRNRAVEGGGLYLAALSQIRVENNVFFLNDASKGGGALVAADATATLTHNTFAHIQYLSGLPAPTAEAIRLLGAANGSKVVNNIVAGHRNGVIGEANLRAFVAGNDFYSTLAPWQGVPVNILFPNRQIGDPLFVRFDPRRAIGDFHLQVNSPCRNLALPQFTTNVDRDGRRRDSLPDRGAYEYIAP